MRQGKLKELKDSISVLRLVVMCHIELEKRPVLGSVYWPEALHLGSSGKMSRNLSGLLLKTCTGWLEMLEMHAGRRFQRLLAVNAKEELRAILAGL